MRELREMAVPRISTPAVRLHAQTAALAGRLADILSRSVPSTGPASASLTFLSEYAASAATPLHELQGTDPIDRLAAGLALSRFEVDLLILAGMPEEHEGVAGVIRSLHPRGEPRPTVGLAGQLLCQSGAERLLLRESLETGPLARSGAIRVPGEVPFVERDLVIADALWNVLLGLDAWPSSLSPITEPSAAAGLEEWFASPSARRVTAALLRGEVCTVLVLAQDEEIALHRVAALAAAAGVSAVKLALPPNAPPETVRLGLLHALARGAIPLLRVSAGDGSGATPLPRVDAFPGPAMVCARFGSGAVRGSRPVLTLPVDRLTHSALAQTWAEALPQLASDAPLLAARYAIDPTLVAEVAGDVTAVEAVEERTATLADVAESVRARCALAVATGAQLMRPQASWENLVLPPDRLSQLREAEARLLYQGRVLDEWGFLAGKSGARGVRMLFAGPPGTGKTLSAEVLASALGVDLLIVDISRVVSKWIGETEKNLAQVFDVAERAQAVLFFDEADALFGKRTEVSDARDRYANLETAYLLSRLEKFEGLAVLSTNLRQNIDGAFLRRLEFVIDFEEPGVVEREALWRCHLPKEAPLAADVRIAELASLYPVVGGFIRNASVAAAFLAAAAGTAITRHHFLRALQREYEKAGRTFPGTPAGMTR